MTNFDTNTDTPKQNTRDYGGDAAADSTEGLNSSTTQSSTTWPHQSSGYFSPSITPTATWIKERPWRLFAFGFGTGLSPMGPGTVGTLWAWIATLTYHVFFPSLEIFESYVLLVAAFVVGCYVCGLTGKELNKPDHGGMVLDEMVAFWLILFFILPSSWLVQTLAFIFFRFFDISKPGPIRTLDNYFKQWQPSPTLAPYAVWIRGFGVMIDDIFAALATLFALAVLIRLGVIAL